MGGIVGWSSDGEGDGTGCFLKNEGKIMEQPHKYPVTAAEFLVQAP